MDDVIQVLPLLDLENVPTAILSEIFDRCTIIKTSLRQFLEERPKLASICSMSDLEASHAGTIAENALILSFFQLNFSDQLFSESQNFIKQSVERLVRRYEQHRWVVRHENPLLVNSGAKCDRLSSYAVLTLLAMLHGEQLVIKNHNSLNKEINISKKSEEDKSKTQQQSPTKVEAKPIQQEIEKQPSPKEKLLKVREPQQPRNVNVQSDMKTTTDASKVKGTERPADDKNLLKSNSGTQKMHAPQDLPKSDAQNADVKSVVKTERIMSNTQPHQDTHAPKRTASDEPLAYPVQPLSSRLFALTRDIHGRSREMAQNFQAPVRKNLGEIMESAAQKQSVAEVQRGKVGLRVMDQDRTSGLISRLDGQFGMYRSPVRAVERSERDLGSQSPRLRETQELLKSFYSSQNDLKANTEVRTEDKSNERQSTNARAKMQEDIKNSNVASPQAKAVQSSSLDAGKIQLKQSLDEAEKMLRQLDLEHIAMIDKSGQIDLERDNFTELQKENGALKEQLTQLQQMQSYKDQTNENTISNLKQLAIKQNKALQKQQQQLNEQENIIKKLITQLEDKKNDTISKYQQSIIEQPKIVEIQNLRDQNDKLSLENYQYKTLNEQLVQQINTILEAGNWITPK